MNKTLTIFVDTDAFVALAKEDDTNHEKALSFLHALLNLSVVFVTSNYVFSESVTVISMRKSHEAAVQFIDTMQSEENQYLLKRADEALEEEAIQFFRQQTSKNTSYVDCTNMAFLKRLHADAIFSFDDCYRKNGFILVENLFAQEQQAA